ncbi:MAG: hypothetical protein KAS04_03510 [Candidatus Aenigmarchaeota archaeon]|nr:hypothetical protein [Candidatus Aenigmarchaeota archaeon]
MRRGKKSKRSKTVCGAFGSFGILTYIPIRRIHNTTTKLDNAKIREERFLLPTKTTRVVLRTIKATTKDSIVAKLS